MFFLMSKVFSYSTDKYKDDIDAEEIISEIKDLASKHPELNIINAIATNKLILFFFIHFVLSFKIKKNNTRKYHFIPRFSIIILQ